MTSIRILLVDLPGLLQEIVRATIADRTDMVVVGKLSRDDPLARVIRRKRVDVVLLGRDDAALATRLLGQTSRVAVLAVTHDGKESWLYQLRPQRIRLGEASPAQLVQAIARAAGVEGCS